MRAKQKTAQRAIIRIRIRKNLILQSLTQPLDAWLRESALTFLASRIGGRHPLPLTLAIWFYITLHTIFRGAGIKAGKVSFLLKR
jgi:hypothetical protein